MRSLNTRVSYRIVGADFSAQEPRLTAHYSGDDNMINAYKEGKDLYSVIASMSFDAPYEDCLEFYPEGTKLNIEGQEVICGHKTHKNKAGAERRTMAKSILLGLLYGRGAPSIGEQINKTRDEAQAIIDKFFKAFPKVKKWIDKTMSDAHKYGYVEDIAGRRRRLPDILLPQYDVKFKNKASGDDFNPLIGALGLVKPAGNAIIQKYKNAVEKTRNRKEYESLKLSAEREGILINNNGGFISQAERQAVNSRVQGGAATLTKTALVKIYNDERLRKLQANLINTVHDEILLEVPECYSEEAAELLSKDMIDSAKVYVDDVPMSCDAYVVTCWYVDEFFVTVQKEFKKMLEEDKMPDLDAFEKLCEIRTESTRDQLYEIVHEYMHNIPENVTLSKS